LMSAATIIAYEPLMRVHALQLSSSWALSSSQVSCWRMLCVAAIQGYFCLQLFIRSCSRFLSTTE